MRRKIKKILLLPLFLSILLLFVVFPIGNIEATSGACSWHGGVNCAAGPDWDGSVICNDGWGDSSVSYYSMVKCQGYYDYDYPSYTPNIPDCPLNSYYDSLTDSCKCYSGYVVSGGKCISADQYCRDLFGFNARYNILTDSCECSYGYIFSGNRCIDGDSYCHDKYGIHSSYESFSESCKCNYGYIFDSLNQCVTEDEYCQNLYGFNAEHSFLDDGCKCKSGYVFNSSMTKCIDGDSYCQDEYGYHATYNSLSKECECDYGYKLKNGECVTPEISRVFPLEAEIGEEVTVQGENFGNSKYGDLNLYVGSIKVDSLDISKWQDSKIVFEVGDYLESGNIILKDDTVNIRGSYLEILEPEDDYTPIYSFTPQATSEEKTDKEPKIQSSEKSQPETETKSEIQSTGEEPQLSEFQETKEEERQIIAGEQKQEKKKSVRAFFANIFTTVRNFFSKIFKWF